MNLRPYSKERFIELMEVSEDGLISSEDRIADFFDWMYADEDGIVEACAFHIPSEDGEKRSKANKNFHTTKKDEFVEFCDTHSGLWRYQVYAAVNTLACEPEYGRTDLSTIASVNTIPFDIETKRGSYKGSSKEEVWWSYKYALAQTKFLNERYGVWPLIVMSENGVHLHVKANFPVIEDYIHGKQHIYSKYVTHEAMNNKYTQLVKENAPDTVEFAPDDVSDVPRVMKVPGTLGIKSDNGRLCGIIHQPPKSEAGCIDITDISDIEIEQFRRQLEEDNESQSNSTSNIHVAADMPESDTPLKDRIQRLKKEDNLFNALWQGEMLHYDSRSEAEMAFVMKLLSQGFSESQIRDTLTMSGMTKWNEASQHYRDRTIEQGIAEFDGKVTRDSTSSQLSFKSL